MNRRIVRLVVFASLIVFAGCLLSGCHPQSIIEQGASQSNAAADNANANANAFEVDRLPNLPPKKSPRKRNVDIEHIALELQFDWPSKTAMGRAVILLSPLSTQSQVTLDAGRLKIQKVKLKSGNSLKFEYDGTDRDDALKIFLDRQYLPTESISLEIDYQTTHANELDPNNLWGSHGKGLRFSVPTTMDPIKPQEIWSMGLPESNRYWFPGFDSLGDPRSFELMAIVPKPLRVISNGELLSVKALDKDNMRYHWRLSAPQENYQSALVVGTYTEIESKVGEIAIHHFSYPSEVEDTKASVVRLPDMMKYYQETTGQSYPFARYSQVFVQDSPGGIGNAMFATQTENMVDDKGTHDDYLYLWDGLESDTLAQQWFGAMVRPRAWADFWLSRGFSHQLENQFTEHLNGRDEFLLWQHRGDLSAYMGDWSGAIYRPVATSHYDDVTALATDNIGYGKGALILNLLRMEMGEANWSKLIKTFVKKHAWKSVSTEGFQLSVESITGKDMDWFFQQWIHGSGHPRFKVSKSFDALAKRLTIEIQQTPNQTENNPYPQISNFQGHLQLEIDGKIETVWIEAKAVNTFHFSMEESPSFVNPDFESHWIKELQQDQTLTEWLALVHKSLDALAVFNGIVHLGNLGKSDTTSATEKKQIQAALREVSLSQRYWRLRQAAVQQLQGLEIPNGSTSTIALNADTEAVLLRIIATEKSWLKASALQFLGATRQSRYFSVYRDCFSDPSDRVISAAAIAMGKTNHPQAFEAFMTLRQRPSWKNQSLMSVLSGLKELKDPRGFTVAKQALTDLELKRWRLSTPPVWDLRVFALDTILALGRGAAVIPLLHDQFHTTVKENDVGNMLRTLMHLAKIGDARSEEIFVIAKTKAKGNVELLLAIELQATAFSELRKHLTLEQKS